MSWHLKRYFQVLLSTILLFVGIAVSEFSKAQAYVPILSDSCTWYLTNYYFGFNSSSYFAKEDTVINNLNYKVLDGFHFNKNVFVREDTVARKFYYRQILGFRANEDILIYDFNLTVGDSMILYNPNVGGYSDSAGMFTLDSIAMVSTLDGPRKMYFLSGPPDNNGNAELAEWIEGVGSTYAINSGGARGDLYGKGETTCMFKNDLHVYETAISEEVGSCVIYTVGEEEISAPVLKIYPNPARDRLYVDFDRISDVKLILFSLTGQTYKVSDMQDGSFDISEIPSGFYLLKLIESGNIRMTSRLIIE